MCAHVGADHERFSDEGVWFQDLRSVLFFP